MKAIIDGHKYDLLELTPDDFIAMVRNNLNICAYPVYYARFDDGLRLFPTDRELNQVEDDNGNVWIV